MALVPILEEIKEAFSYLVNKHQLGEKEVQVRVEPLSPQQVIGVPARKDFALLQGKEVMVEAEFQGRLGQAFTEQPFHFAGTIRDVQSLSLHTPGNRAIFVATINAVAAHLGLAHGTCHCKDDEPERCGSTIAQELLQKFGKVRVYLGGFQPALLEHLVSAFGVENVICGDMNPANVGSEKFGGRIHNGRTDTSKLVEWCDVALVTSSALANGTYDDINEEVISAGKRLILFGVTGAGIAAIYGLDRVCPLAHDSRDKKKKVD